MKKKFFSRKFMMHFPSLQGIPPLESHEEKVS